MLMLPYMAVYMGCGLLMVRWLLPRQQALYRLWLGAALGLFLLMWLPALMAFVLSFSVAGHLAALVPLGVLTGAAYWFRDTAAPAAWHETDTRHAMLLAALVLPLTLLGVWLQYTHNLRVEDGAYYVGQSTFGDLSLHTGIITSLRGARFPADYSILPGARLSYPFLADSLSTTFMLFGFSLQAALSVPGVLMMALTFAGFLLLALRISTSRRVAGLAFLLVFINGGLGFLYPLDMLGTQSLGTPTANALQHGTWLERLQTILQGWYQTPVNHAEFATYNLRWSNIIADMLIPQRTFLGGWTILMPCLYLLWDSVRTEGGTRQLVLLGVLAGGLPLIHTHSFLALGLCSLGWMVYSLLKKGRLAPWLIYGIIAVALALPQLLVFTFQQAGNSAHFLRFQFNWVNNPGGAGLRDGYLWFWLKNIGLPFILLVFSLFEKNEKHRFLYAGAFTIFVVAELVLFQPNEYDNNKLFYVWYALCAVPISAYAFSLWDRLKGLRARPLMAGLACVVLFLSGGLSILRECLGTFQAYSKQAVQAAAWTEAHTPQHSLFMAAAEDHLNPISALSGRRIVAGPDLWLYYHGFDTDSRKQDIARFYEDPRQNIQVLTTWQADYVLLGPAERRHYGTQESTLDDLFERVYADEYGDYIIYRVPPG